MRHSWLTSSGSSRRALARVAWIVSIGLAASRSLHAQQVAPSDSAWAAVDRAMGRAGQTQPDGVRKYSFPRSDLRVTVAGLPVKPALALGSWIAFHRPAPTDSNVLAMGDLVLLEAEVTPVIARLRQAGIEQTALHNHLQAESPRVMYLHIEARGTPARIAAAVHDALALTGTPLAQPAASKADLAGLDTAAITRALGYPGSASGGVYHVSVARADPVTMDGAEVPHSMGLATSLNFQPTGDGGAAITGDFVMIGSEVNPVVQALQASRIAVTAIHSHMIGEEPRLYFLHFWATGNAVQLARGLRGALDAMNVRR